MPRYVPILKGKEGEFAALEVLVPEIKDQVTPLIEIPAVPFDYSTGRNAKTLDKHIKTLPDRIHKSWADRPFYLETPFFGEEEQLEDDQYAFGVLLQRCLERGLQPIPVISTSSSDGCRAAILDHVQEGSPLCVRLSMSDFAEDVETGDEVIRILRSVGRDTSRVLTSLSTSVI